MSKTKATKALLKISKLCRVQTWK